VPHASIRIVLAGRLPSPCRQLVLVHAPLHHSLAFPAMSLCDHSAVECHDSLESRQQGLGKIRLEGFVASKAVLLHEVQHPFARAARHAHEAVWQLTGKCLVGICPPVAALPAFGGKPLPSLATLIRITVVCLRRGCVYFFVL
jgi:hypothetical protein